MQSGATPLDTAADGLRTVVLISVTPFGADGAVADQDYAKVLEHAVGAGVTTVTTNGNTSEFYSLSPHEIDRSLAITVETVSDRALIIAGVGHEVPRAERMARDAARAGADAIMVHQPVHPYLSEDGWVDYHRSIADTVPDLGVVCYVRSPHIGGAAIGRLADACPNVVGVKYAVPDPVRFADAVTSVDAGRLVWVCGLAELWAPQFHGIGATGFTSGLANVAPTLSLRLHDQLRRGDTAAALRLWRRLKPFEDLRARNGNAHNVSAVKEALAQLGLCARSVRPPISELPPPRRDEVAAILADWREA